MINNKSNINIMLTTLLLKMNLLFPKLMILLVPLKNQEMFERNLQRKKKQHRNLKQTCQLTRKYNHR